MHRDDKEIEIRVSHESMEREEGVVGSTEKAFGFTFAAVAVLVGIGSWWMGNRFWPVWIGVGAFFAAVALLLPGALRPFNRAWLKLGLWIHAVVSPVVLGIIFFGVITPISLVMRLCGKTQLRLSRDADARTYWRIRDHDGSDPESMKNQF